jgi:threonine dehydratase
MRSLQPSLPSLTGIQSAAELIRPHIPPTPCYAWPLLQESTGCEVWVKHENHTPLGAFKVRGGMVYLDELLKAEPDTPGVIAASTGNHGQSIAWNARQRGLRAVIVVPKGNNPDKNAAMRSLGAELIEHGSEFQEALEHSCALATRQGLHAVPSFHPWLVRGVATYALEFFQSAPPLDAVYVPIGLGSGFCGVAAAREALGLKTRLIGVVSAQAPAYALSFQQQKKVIQISTTRVAEGVACSTPNELALEWVMRYADDLVTITDAEALTAMRDLIQATHNLAEGAGALAYAAIKKHQPALKGQRVGCILSGGNASLTLLSQAIHH